MTIKDILESKDALAKLNNTQGMPSVVAYRIGKSIKALDNELQTYDEVRTKMLTEAANKDEEGKPVIIEETRQYDIPKDKLEDIYKEIEKLQREEVNVEFKKVSVDDISKADLTPRELMQIDFMLEE